MLHKLTLNFANIWGIRIGDKRKRPVGPNRTKTRLLNTLLDRKLDSHKEGVCDCVWLGRP
ncbi:hypothetical protein DPMN_097573 [Dreissena polymorpha]|uniref:Uncharacterized protein n=1 Tax=Dreissena polymorpha TaxID=45954 RepID=A0A9D4R5I7_DREPO|nr:hypothetical protein DPMN_097573 [Dreissena polymorpha]